MGNGLCCGHQSSAVSTDEVTPIGYTHVVANQYTEKGSSKESATRPQHSRNKSKVDIKALDLTRAKLFVEQSHPFSIASKSKGDSSGYNSVSSVSGAPVDDEMCLLRILDAMVQWLTSSQQRKFLLISTAIFTHASVVYREREWSVEDVKCATDIQVLFANTMRVMNSLTRFGGMCAAASSVHQHKICDALVSATLTPTPSASPVTPVIQVSDSVSALSSDRDVGGVDKLMNVPQESSIVKSGISQSANNGSQTKGWRYIKWFPCDSWPVDTGRSKNLREVLPSSLMSRVEEEIITTIDFPPRAPLLSYLVLVRQKSSRGQMLSMSDEKNTRLFDPAVFRVASDHEDDQPDPEVRDYIEWLSLQRDYLDALVDLALVFDAMSSASNDIKDLVGKGSLSIPLYGAARVTDVLQFAYNYAREHGLADILYNTFLSVCIQHRNDSSPFVSVNISTCPMWTRIEMLAAVARRRATVATRCIVSDQDDRKTFSQVYSILFSYMFQLDAPPSTVLPATSLVLMDPMLDESVFVNVPTVTTPTQKESRTRSSTTMSTFVRARRTILQYRHYPSPRSDQYT